MREGAFKTWLKKYPARTQSGRLDDSTINAHLTRLRQIENEELVNLDDKFKYDKLANMIERFQEGNDRIRRMHVSSSALSAIQSQLNKYREFCEQNPPK